MWGDGLLSELMAGGLERAALSSCTHDCHKLSFGSSPFEEASCNIRHTLNYQNLLSCRVPINSILGFIIRTYKKVGFGRLRQPRKQRHTPQNLAQSCIHRVQGALWR